LTPLTIEGITLPAKKEEKSKSAKKTDIAVRGRDDIDRFFSDYARRFDSSLPSMFQGGWFGPRWWRSSFELPETRHAFADLIDAGKEYRVRVEVPGIPKDKINISVTPRGIKIEGEAETKIDEDKEGYVRKERTWSKVSRELAFPEEVIPDSADAEVKDGIVEVKVPKKNPTEVKVHKVQVK
jgi:HSP20 family protein